MFVSLHLKLEFGWLWISLNFDFDAFELFSFKVILAENEVRSLTILLFLQFVNAFFGKAKKQSPDLNQSLVVVASAVAKVNDDQGKNCLIKAA